MSLSRPNEPHHFQANLIWWDSPFNSQSNSPTLEYVQIKILLVGQVDTCLSGSVAGAKLRGQLDTPPPSAACFGALAPLTDRKKAWS